MGMMDDLVAALRGHKSGDAAAKGTLGQDGVAGVVNGDNRSAYNMYAEGEITAGRQPLPYADWYAQQRAAKQ